MDRKTVRLCDNIRIYRNRNGLTQTQLAEICFVTRQTVSAWEKDISSPDIDALAKMSNAFGMTANELLFGRLPEEIIEEQDFIKTIHKKGFYAILEEDIQTFFPVIYLRFAQVMGIAMELKEKGYQIVSVYPSGFSIYLPTDEEAEKFSSVLYNIIDAFIHHEKEKTAVSYSKVIQERIDQIEMTIMKETHKAIFGAEMDDMFYWVDEYDRIRGYGKNETDCKTQANEQNCNEYTILHE